MRETSSERDKGTQTPVLGTELGYVDGVGEKQDIARSVRHVDQNGNDSDDYVTYNSVPPTSGDHWSTPAHCGFYVEPVPDEMIVHNMEHSNIIVSYNLPDQADVDALEALYDDLPNLWRDHFTVVRPYQRIEEGTVAISAWGVLDAMEGVDEGGILRFFEHYVGRLGPEGAISCRGTQDAMTGG